MKVYLHLEEESSHDLPEMTVKLTLPKSWQKTGFDRLKKTFVTSYNKKHSKELEEQDWHLESADGKVYAEDAAVKSMISSGADLYMRRGAGKTMEDLGIAPPPEETPKVEKVQPPPTSVKAKAAPKCTPVSAPKPADKEKDKRLVCKRFGCQARYLPGDNHEEACRYHAKPPIFHETRKWWACCPKKVAWDWDTFTAIPGCMVGAHSDVAQDKKFMGGADVRAEQAKAYEYAPKPSESQRRNRRRWKSWAIFVRRFRLSAWTHLRLTLRGTLSRRGTRTWVLKCGIRCARSCRRRYRASWKIWCKRSLAF